MNPKLDKCRMEYQKNAQRITVLQTRNAKLEKQIMELESMELHSLLHGAGMTYQDLTTYIRERTGEALEPDESPELDDFTDLEAEPEETTQEDSE